MTGVQSLDLALDIDLPAREKLLAGIRAKRRRLEEVLDTPADDVQLALKGEIVRQRTLSADEYLPNDRHGVARRGTQRRGIDRHRSPAEYGLAFLAYHALKRPLANLPAAFVGRQEDHADTVLTRSGQRDAEPGAFLLEEGVRHLHENARAVAGVLLATAGAAVFQVVQDLERIADDVVRLAIFEIDHEADAAGVVFVARIVQALLGGERARGHVTSSFSGRSGHATFHYGDAGRWGCCSPSAGR